jgi:hypothetical protein
MSTSRQEGHTNICLNESPGLSFGQMLDVLMTLYGMRESERGRFVARVNKVQRAGVPIGTNVGKGPRVRYSLDQFFQLLIVMELAELSISLTNASLMVREFWPRSPVSLAPAHAWLGIMDGDPNSVLLLASASELEGFAKHPDIKAAATAAAGRFIVGAPPRPHDRLTTVTSDRLIRDGRFDLGATSFRPQVWRTSLVDMSGLVSFVVHILDDKELVSETDFTDWAKQQCDDFFAAEAAG